MIETWGFYFFNAGTVPGRAAPTPEQVQEAYERYNRLWVDCERFGFDGLSFAEHHFNPGCLAPSTHLVVASLAAQTSTLRFTTLGSVLPLHDARRFVEEIGMLDYLTKGRYEPGIAPGAGDFEALKAGLSSEEVRPRYHSAADVLLKAIEGPTVTQHDRFTNLDDVAIVPRMRPETGRSVWVTVMSPGSAAWSAQRGHKICTGWLPTPVAAQVAQAYRDSAAEAGRQVDPQMLGLRRRVFVADSDAEAHDKYDASVDVMKAGAAAAGQDLESADSKIAAMLMEPDDFAIGSPETVTEKLVEQCRTGGYGALMAFTDFALFDHADLVRSHELIGTKVAPALRSADLADEGSQVLHA